MEFYTVVVLLTFVLIIIISSIPLPPHTFIQGLNLPFLQILPAVAFLFFYRIDSADSPDCLPILLSISVFYFLFFSVFPLLSFWFRAVD